MTFRSFSHLLWIGVLTACQSGVETGETSSASAPRDLKEEARLHQAGLVLIPDLQHASAWEKLIHLEMGVSARKIEVRAGPGFTTILIKNLNQRSAAEGVAQELRSLAEKQPDRFGPTKVEVSLENGAPTINPFALPTQSAPTTVKPEAALPTLSLPPLQPAAR